MCVCVCGSTATITIKIRATNIAGHSSDHLFIFRFKNSKHTNGLIKLSGSLRAGAAGEVTEKYRMRRSRRRRERERGAANTKYKKQSTTRK